MSGSSSFILPSSRALTKSASSQGQASAATPAAAPQATRRLSLALITLRERARRGPEHQPLKKGEMIDKMIRLAVKGHAGQFDKGGNPYILHVLKVMDNLHTDDEELQCIAVGHDLIEDTKITAKEMFRQGISLRVVTAIEKLTKKKGQTDDEYLNIVLSDVDCMRVKKADLQHNSDIRRLKGVRPKDITRIIKYHDMWLKIDARLQSIPPDLDSGRK
jgi:guanosine-3',5'-bis(diphosphate) 3'-pyrophosphohydrolase